MDRDEILLAIDSEIARLQEAKELLTGGTNDSSVRRKADGRAAKAAISKATSSNPAEFTISSREPRKLSAAGRAEIAAAQRARWAKLKKESKAKEKSA